MGLTGETRGTPGDRSLRAEPRHKQLWRDLLTYPAVETRSAVRRHAIIRLVTTPETLPEAIAALIAERERAARIEAELAIAKAKVSEDQALIAHQ